MLDLLSRMYQSVVTPMLWLSLTAAFVAVIVMILRRILRSRIPHQALCVLWLIVFARLLLPVSVETPFSLVPSNITNQIYQTEQEQEQPVEPEAESQPSSVIPERPEPVEPTPAPVVSAPVSQPQIPATSDSIPSLPVASNPVVSDPVVPEPQPSAPPVIEEEPSIPETPVLSEKEIRVRSGQAIAASVWLLGVAAMLVSGIVSYAKLRRQVYDAIRAEDGVWEHPSLRSPFILGLFRPKIYLPMGIAGPARQFILHHERAHLRRWDHVVKPICWLALAIHWFNPFAWGAFLLMSRDIEAACDESVIRKLGSEVKADYSATLLALATDKRFPAPSPLSFGEGDAEDRIKNVLKFKKPVLWVSIGAVVVAAIAAVCLLTNQSPRSLDSFYPQANWETAEIVTAYFPKNEFPEDPEKVELSTEAAAEMTEVFHKYKYWRELSHLIPDNRVGWYDSLWKVCYQFENGSEITLNYSASGTLVVYHHSGLLPDGSAVNRRDRHYTVDGAEQFTAEILEIIMREFELASVGTDLSAYTTMDDYPGLYFLEEPSSTVGTKVTAYKLIEGELVLVGGYEEHQANNFDVLIHADGELEAIWSGQNVYTKFEELLMAALDPAWPNTTKGEPEEEFLTDLPTELVTYNTLPADPEEYYLVAELPEQHIWLYAQNWGQDSMLRWDNSWWPLEGRVAHSHHMTLPRMFLLEETPGKTTAAVISQIGTGTGVELYELAAYVMGGHTAEAGNSFGMQNYVYDWRSAAEHFNQNNTLLYDAETDALTLFWNGTAYFSGTLGQDLSQHFGLEDGFTGALVVNGDIIRFEHIEGSRFAVTAVPCIAKGGQGYFAEEGWWRWVNEDNYCFPMSVGVTGFTLTWTVEFNGSGFDQVGEVSIAAPATAKPGTPDYANEIMAAIGGFVEKRQAIPQDYLLYLTEEQRAMAEDYNRQTKTIRGGAASAVIDVVSVIKGEEISYYDLEDTEYQIIGQLADALLFPDYGTRIRENGELNAYLSQRPDSIIRLDSAMAQHFASWAGYQGITVGGYCELADRLYRSLNQGGPVPTTDAAMAASMLILERQAVSEDVLSQLDGDIAGRIKKYNEQTSELKDVYYKKADSLRYALFYEENRTTQQWYREAFAQRLSAFALYKNYSQLAWTDPLTSQVASYEAGGSYGLWATYFRHEGERLELPQNLLDYLSLVESLLIRLNQAD